MIVFAVHPRVCGEHFGSSNRHILWGGSSPRVRGTCLHGCYSHPILRFIPACAGNILPTCNTDPQKTVHPRVCGEHVSLQLSGIDPAGSSPRVRGTYSKHSGSSPRVRGTFAFMLDNNSLNRFIPACAGNISVMEGCGLSHSVHPRVCGEHEVSFTAPTDLDGSSPRVRGT